MTRTEIKARIADIHHEASMSAVTGRLFDTLRPRPGCETVFAELGKLLDDINAAAEAKARLTADSSVVSD